MPNQIAVFLFRFTLIIVTQLTIFALIGCSGGSSSPASSIDGFSYNGEAMSLQVGNRWEYEVKIIRVNTDTTLNSEIFHRLNSEYESTHLWEVTGEELVGDQRAFRIDITEEILSGPLQGEINTGTAWIAIGDGRYLKSQQNTNSLEAGFGAKMLVQEEEWSILVEYPLKIGKQWEVCSPAYNRCFSKPIRQVSARERLTVQAGTFDVYKLKTVIRNPDDDINTYERWYGSVGLVKSIDDWGGTQIRTNARGQQEGEFFIRYRTEMELKGYSIQ